MGTQIKSILSFPLDFSEEGLNTLATRILNEICICNGKHKYHPIEIEFYIYDKENHPDTHVYPREAKAGDIFFHLSGMDICFESSFEEKNGTIRFGGILIRALEREDVKLTDNKPLLQFGGPLTCVNEVLNTSESLNDIQVVHCNHSSLSAKCIGKRKGINQSKTLTDEYWNKKYRFLRDDLNVGDKITMESLSFDFKDKKIKEKHKRYYKIED